MRLMRVKVGDLGAVITGNTPPRKDPDYYGSAYPFIKPTDIELDTRYTLAPEECYSEKAYEKYKKSLIPAGSTCVVTIGSIGRKITMAFTDCFINQAMNAVVPSKHFDPYYVFYLLKQNLYKVKALDSGTSSGRENVSKSAFSSIEVDVHPDLNVQNRIGSILSAYDNLIENNLRRIQLLEEAARCQYKLLLEESLDLVKVDFRSIVSWTKGKKPKDITSENQPSYLPYLVFDTLEETGFFYAHSEKVPVATLGDVLMCMDGARSGVVFRGQEGVLGSTFAYIRPKDLRLSEYIFQFLSDNLSYIVQGNVGSAIPHANREYINDMEISLPVDDALTAYNENVQSIPSQIRNLKRQNVLLRQARDILLPQLMSGEIDMTSVAVPDASAMEHIEAV